MLSRGRILRYTTVIGALTKRRHASALGANEPFFRIDDSPPTAGITQFSREGRKKSARTGERPPARPSARAALVLTSGIFRRQAFREIYGEVTAWIAMNSAHPPLSGLVIVLNLLAPAGVTYTCVYVSTWRRERCRHVLSRQTLQILDDNGPVTTRVPTVEK